jgi:hypothetical protein
MFKLLGHIAWDLGWSLSMGIGIVAWACSMDISMQYFHAAWVGA